MQKKSLNTSPPGGKRTRLMGMRSLTNSTENL